MANCSISLPSRDQWPVGFRFYPTDEELLNHYLKNKVFGNESLVAYVPQIDVNNYEPWDLPGLLNDRTGVEKLFFFAALDFKNSNSKRSSRVTKAGFWKSTGNDLEIRARGTNQLIGTKKTLVYHRGRARNGNRTNWVIHEYRLPTDTRFANLSPYVVCRLKKKSDVNVAQFDGSNDLVHSTNVNAITVNGIQESSPRSHCSGQPAFPDSQSFNATDYGVNSQPMQIEATEPHFNIYDLLHLVNSPQQPALPDFQPHFEDGTSQVGRFPFHSQPEPALMDFQPTNGNDGEVNNQLLRPGASESDVCLTEYLYSTFENENNNEVTSRICIDYHDRVEPSNWRDELQYDRFSRGSDNVADFEWQGNHIPLSRSYRYVGSATKSVKCFQSREEKEIYLHEALKGSSSGSIGSIRNVFSHIITTKRIQHKSAHPLVYIAKAFLGIILFIVLALELLLHSN